MSLGQLLVYPWYAAFYNLTFRDYVELCYSQQTKSKV